MQVLAIQAPRRAGKTQVLRRLMEDCTRAYQAFAVHSEQDGFASINEAPLLSMENIEVVFLDNVDHMPREYVHYVLSLESQLRIVATHTDDLPQWFASVVTQRIVFEPETQ